MNANSIVIAAYAANFADASAKAFDKAAAAHAAMALFPKTVTAFRVDGPESFSKLDGPSLVRLYNALASNLAKTFPNAGRNPPAPVKKFQDRATALRRLYSATIAFATAADETPVKLVKAPPKKAKAEVEPKPPRTIVEALAKKRDPAAKKNTKALAFEMISRPDGASLEELMTDLDLTKGSARNMVGWARELNPTVEIKMIDGRYKVAGAK